MKQLMIILQMNWNKHLDKKVKVIIKFQKKM